jgi:hypothetical protein
MVHCDPLSVLYTWVCRMLSDRDVSKSRFFGLTPLTPLFVPALCALRWPRISLRDSLAARRVGGCGVGNSENLPLFRVAATRGTVPVAAVVRVRWWVWMVDVQLCDPCVRVSRVAVCVPARPR